MQTPKARSGSSELPQKVSPRVARHLRPTTLDIDTVSSSNKARTPNNRNLKVTDHRSPRSPVPERKRPSRVSQLEYQNSQLQLDIKKVSDELDLSESCKKVAQQDAEESNNRLLAVSQKLRDSEKRLLELSASEETWIVEGQQISKKHKETWDSEPEIVPKQVLIDHGALYSSMNEIQRLKNQLELVDKSENEQIKRAQFSGAELQILKGNLTETLQLVENMKNQLNNCKRSEADAQALAGRTLQQLETAKRTVEALREDATKTIEAYDSIFSELEHSRARVKFLEAVINKLEIDLGDNGNIEQGAEKHESEGESDLIEQKIFSLKSENEHLRSLLETAEYEYNKEQVKNTVQIRSAYELIEQIKSESTKSEAGLQAELEKRRCDIEELKANLMDKETQLQSILEENEGMNLKLQKKQSYQGDSGLGDELKTTIECINELRANLMDKETMLQVISEKNEVLKLEIKKREAGNSKGTDIDVGELESAKASEREALVKLEIVMEEADSSNRKVVRVTEQLEAAQAANTEMEAELRRLKVQSNQWRKAAEAAVAMLAGGNGDKFNYHSLTDKFSPYSEDIADDFQKKRNVTMLKKIGVLWKKPQKY